MSYLTFKTAKNNYLFNPGNGHIYLCAKEEINGISELLNGISGNKNIVKEIIPGYSFNEVEEAVNKKLKQMTLCVTQDCNLRCNYCVYSGQFKYYRKHKKNYMTEKLAMDAANYFLNHASADDDLYFTFYGGEPFLNFPLISKVQKYLKDNLNERVNFSITTNGTLLNKAIIDFIIYNKIFLTISLDGEKTTHDKNRKFANGEGSFDRIMKNIENLKNAYGELFGVYVSFSTTLSANCDYKELDSFFCNFKNSVRVSGVQFYGSESIESIAGNSKNMAYAVDKYIKGTLMHVFDDDYKREPYRFSASIVGRGIKIIHLRNISDSKIYDKTFFLKKHCIPGSTKLFVTPNGDLFPCEKLDSYSHLRLGNIYTKVDASVVYKYLEEYTALRNKYCKDCYLLDICDQCFLSASNGEKWDEEKMIFYCNNARNEYKKAFSIYAQILEEDINAFDYMD